MTRRGRRGLPIPAFIFMGMLLFLPASASSNETDVQELRQQIKDLNEKVRELEALKTKLREVEEKLSRMERNETELQTKTEEKEEANGEPGYENPLETELKQVEKKVERISPFEFHGYFRAGAGQNYKGGNQVCFQDPGAPVKFRLGNECEDYAEIRFDMNVYGSKQKKEPYFLVQIRPAFDGGWLTSYQKSQLFVPELFVEGGNLVGGFLKGARFWAGKRFYRRSEVHIDDFYFWNTSGPGAGVEEIDVGLGKLAFAYLRLANIKSDIFATEVYNSDGTPRTVNGQPVLRTVEGLSYVENNDVVSKQELRWYDIPVSDKGTIALGLELRTLDGGEGDYNGDYGIMINGMYTHHLWGGFNQVILQYGQGLASSLAVATDYNAPDDAKTYRFIDQLMIQPDPRYSAEFVAIYQNATGRQSQPRQWISFGMRPIYNLTDHFRIAMESGVDFVYPRGGEMRRLAKITLAPELAAGRKFFDRPVLRLFVTYAQWNKAAGDSGVVMSDSGTSPFGNDRHGLTFGVQAESWW